ncbi:hypothetical protein ACCS93_34960 [Rhizobium ruizarguesonis]
MLVGYARVSTADQNQGQSRRAGRGDRVRSWRYLTKLDRLARSMKQLITTVEDLKARAGSASAP